MKCINERRSYPRQSYELPLKYSLSILDVFDLKKVVSTGVSLDISRKGLGIYADFPVENGHVLRFIENTSKDMKEKKLAIVRWVKRDGKKLRAGLEFV
ncbi:MAG: PilZ domain-containing protein [Nitrospirae bacterium]|nr:PilZ domain-containing protein [Nitrospirota bacterium]